MCSVCHQETEEGFETARKAEDCNDCHEKPPGLVYFLDGPEKLLLKLSGAGSDRLRAQLTTLFAEEDLTVVDGGSPPLTANCVYQTFEVSDPVLVPEFTGLRLLRGEVHVRLTRASLLLGEKHIPSRVHVTEAPEEARRKILDWLATETFRFICATLEEE